MRLYPLFADLRGRLVVVVGGGAVAARKVAALLAAGARIEVGASELDSRLRRLLDLGRIEHLCGEFRVEWLDRAWLVVAATDDVSLNRVVAGAARARRLLVNVVDNAELSSFHVPAVVDRGPVQIAISTAGAAPMLARSLRERVEIMLDPSVGALATMLGGLRICIKRALPDLIARRRWFSSVLDGPVGFLLRQGRIAEARTELAGSLPGTPHFTGRRGCVALVGAGPGDPGLLTLHALRRLNMADVILHDRLVGADILDLARRDAECIDVGKRVGDDPAATQRRIHALMLERANLGQYVVRLKGGDPLIFARGGEELEFLREHRIAYEIVPGITAALACAAYAGVPLTHRAHAHAVQFATAHCRDSLDALDWRMLAHGRSTLALYMAVAGVERVCEQLLKYGRSADTPFALIENGTRSDQRVIVGALSRLPALATRHAVRAPALLIVGEVAAQAAHAGWFGVCADERAAWAAAA